MDIRVAAYRPMVVTSFGRSANAPASITITNSSQNGPVTPVARISNTNNTPQSAQNPAALTPNRQPWLASSPYETRGTRVDILV